MKIPNIWKNKIHVPVSTNQPNLSQFYPYELSEFLWVNAPAAPRPSCKPSQQKLRPPKFNGEVLSEEMPWHGLFHVRKTSQASTCDPLLPVIRGLKSKVCYKQLSKITQTHASHESLQYSFLYRFNTRSAAAGYRFNGHFRNLNWRYLPYIGPM